MTPEEITNFNLQNRARDLIQQKEFVDALFWLRRCSSINNEAKILQAECMLNLVGAEAALSILGRVSPPRTAQYYKLASGCHEALGHYMYAAELLKGVNDWHTDIHLTIKVGHLYKEAANLLPEDHPKRQNLLDLALGAYQSYPNYYSQPPILLSLALLLVIRKEYQAALDTYLRIPRSTDESQNRSIQAQINRLNQHLIDQSLKHAELFLTQQNYRSALRCYESIRNDCKNVHTLKCQAYCYEKLREYHAAGQAYTDIFARTGDPADNEKAFVLHQQHEQQMADYHQQSMFQARQALTQPQSYVINGTTYYDTAPYASASSPDMVEESELNYR